MPDARVTCSKPETLTNIFAFYNSAEDIKEELIRRNIEDLLASEKVPLNIDPLKRIINELFGAQEAIFHNEKKYYITKENGKVIFTEEGGGRRNYTDGILQDRVTGESFYYLAIEDDNINPDLIDEGSIIKYNTGYRGVAEIRLYKGNTGHSSARAKAINNFIIRNKEKDIKNVQSDVKDMVINFQERKERAERERGNREELREIQTRVKKAFAEVDPIAVEGEIVRYVEIISIENPDGPLEG